MLRAGCLLFLFELNLGSDIIQFPPATDDSYFKNF